MAHIKKAILMLLAFSLLAGCTNKDVALSECRLDALKSFGHLRKTNSFGFMAFQHELEDRYVELCMKSKGFKLTPAHDNLKINIVGTEDRDIAMGQSENWTRDFSMYLPK